MPLAPATRDKLSTVGTTRIAAALVKHGLRRQALVGLRPLVASQDVLVGVAGKAMDALSPGSVLVLDGNATSVPVALLARRQAAGVVSNGPLRNAADVARAGLPAWHRPSDPARPLAIDAGDIILGIAAASSSFPRLSSTRLPRKRPKPWPTRSSSPNR